MQRLIKWWKGRKWVYLGYSELQYKDKEGGKLGDAGILHYYVWQNNMKKRKLVYSENMAGLSQSDWYHKNIIPWLEGGDMWKPIGVCVAVKGNLIDFYKGSQ